MFLLPLRPQSFKRKPGRADNERSAGDDNQRIIKRLRTLESSGGERREEQQQSDGPPQEEAELYEHVKQGDDSFDAQTYGEDPTSSSSSSVSSSSSSLTSRPLLQTSPAPTSRGREDLSRSSRTSRRRTSPWKRRTSRRICRPQRSRS